MVRSRVSVTALVISALLLSAHSFALDTTEVFDSGFSDVEFYLGAANLGHGDEAVYGLETVFGIGLVERFGLAVGSVWESSYDLFGSLGELSVSLLGTPVDTEMFDLDLWAGVADAPSDDGLLGASAGGEINVDFKPAGVYLRPEFAWEQTLVEVEDEESGEAEPSYGMLYAVDAVAGAYVNIGGSIQVFVEYANSFERAEDEYEDAGRTAAVGVNWAFSESGELVTEVGWDNDTEEDSYHAGIGLIFALPIGGQ